jgi:hypothetical protein
MRDFCSKPELRGPADQLGLGADTELGVERETGLEPRDPQLGRLNPVRDRGPWQSTKALQSAGTRRPARTALPRRGRPMWTRCGRVVPAAACVPRPLSHAVEAVRLTAKASDPVSRPDRAKGSGLRPGRARAPAPRAGSPGPHSRRAGRPPRRAGTRPTRQPRSSSPPRSRRRLTQQARRSAAGGVGAEQPTREPGRAGRRHGERRRARVERRPRAVDAAPPRAHRVGEKRRPLRGFAPSPDPPRGSSRLVASSSPPRRVSRPAGQRSWPSAASPARAPPRAPGRGRAGRR